MKKEANQKNLGGRTQVPSGGPLVLCPPPHARPGFDLPLPKAAPLFLRKSLERAERLHRTFTTVDRNRAKGLSLHASLKSPTHRWKSAQYRCAPGVKIGGVSRETLRRLYWYWCKSGKSASCLMWRYKIVGRPGRDDVRQFLEACARPQIISMTAGYALLQKFRFTLHRLLDCLSPELRQRIRKLHRERRTLLRSLRKTQLAIQRLCP